MGLEINQQIQEQKIQQCILNIDMTVRHLYFSFADLKELKIPSNSQVFSDAIQYSYIRICTVLDELDILHGLAGEDIFLRETLHCAHPAIKGIKKYSGLKKARNLMLAHLNRDSKKQFIPWWDELIEFKLPRTHKEINQILVFLNLVNTILVSRYDVKFTEFSESVRPSFEKYFEKVEELEKETNDNPTPLDNVEIEIQKRCQEIGLVNFNLDPGLIKYWKHGISRHFKPRKVVDIMKMSDEALKELPEFRLAVYDFIDQMNKKRFKPLTKSEIEGFLGHLITEFRKQMADSLQGN